MIIDRDQLHNGLDRVRRAVDSGNYSELLKLAHLQWSDDILVISVFNQGLFIRTRIECETDGTGDIALDPEKMYRLVGALPKGTLKVSIDQEKYKIQLQSGGSKLKMAGLNPIEYPLWKSPSGLSMKVLWSPLSDGIKMMEAIKVKANIARPALRSGYITCADEENIHFVTSDGHRLCLVKAKYAGDSIDNLIIDRDHLVNMLRLFDEKDEVEIRFDQGNIWFLTETSEACMRAVTGSYVNYKMFSESNRSIQTLVDRTLVSEMISQAMVYSNSNDEISACYVEMTPETIRVYMKEQMDSEICHPSIGSTSKIKMQPYMLNDALKIIKSPNITMWANEEKKIIGINGDNMLVVSLGMAE